MGVFRPSILNVSTSLIVLILQAILYSKLKAKQLSNERSPSPSRRFFQFIHGSQARYFLAIIEAQREVLG